MWFIVCADLGYFYSPSGIILSALELLASKAAPAISACEMHGVVCGFCITQPFGYSMEELIELFGNEEVVDQEMLESFVQAINEELLDEGLIFSPLILEESTSLQDRVHDLSDFCLGFLGGFGAGIALSRRAIPEELEEILEDFTSIGSISDLGLEEQDDEASYLELYEYAKVSVLLAHGVFLESEHSMTLDSDQ